MADAYNPTRTHAPGQQQRAGTANRDEEHGGVSDALRQAVSSAGDVAGQVKDRVEDAWDNASRGVRQGAQAVAETAGDFWSDTTHLIRRYPVASVMIAFGAGLLAASLFSAAPSWTDDVARRMSRGSA
jgi:ElaB/YqjD/DUF883 family membrane-anchored ribosome-binding protein